MYIHHYAFPPNTSIFNALPFTKQKLDFKYSHQNTISIYISQFFSLIYHNPTSMHNNWCMLGNVQNHNGACWEIAHLGVLPLEQKLHAIRNRNDEITLHQYLVAVINKLSFDLDKVEYSSVLRTNVQWTIESVPYVCLICRSNQLFCLNYDLGSLIYTKPSSLVVLF